MKKLKVVAVFSQKGGSGKSTIAIHAAVAASASYRVLLVDADPQGTVLAWSNQRRAVSPAVVRGDAASLRKLLESADSQGFDLAVVDCPPHAAAATATLLQLADHVVIPMQPSMPDLAATQRSIALARAAGKRFSFVLSRVPPRAPEVLQAQEALADAGPVAPVLFGDRRAFARALTDGCAVTEAAFNKSKASSEAQALWAWLNKELDMENTWPQAA